MQQRLWTIVCACLLANACGSHQGQSSLASVDAATAEMSIDSLADSLGHQLTAASTSQLSKDAGALSYGAFQKDASGELRPGRVVLQGVVFEATPESIAAVREEWAAIDSQFSNVKEYWHSIGFDPSSLNQASFAAALKDMRDQHSGSALTETSPSLGLLGGVGDACALAKLAAQCRSQAGVRAAAVNPQTYQTVHNNAPLINAATRAATAAAPNNAGVQNAVRNVRMLQGASQFVVNTGKGQAIVNQNVSVKN